MVLSEKERIVLKKTRLRNLRRRYAKLINRPEMMEECIDLKAEIDSLKMELNS